MASFFRRRRGLIFKAILAVPILWLLVVALLAYQEKDRKHADEDVNPLHQRNVREKRDQWGEQNFVHDNPHGGDEGDNRHENEQKVYNEEQAPDGVVNNDGGDAKQVQHEQAPKPRPHIPTSTTPNPNAPGEMGKAVIIKKEDLSPEERKKYDAGFQKNAFNQYASDMMSLHRSLPDVRDKECRDFKYASHLPDTSVVICFHNEAWSVLLRTVHSVLDRSPAHLIKEIILVDDFSDMDHVKKPLEDYIAKLGKVRIVRAKKREGLIRSRLLGASVATGQVITYLDSHCECTEGWLEPLLDVIAKNKSNVVCPVIDVIEDENFKYDFSSARGTSIGGFDWNLQFNWHPIPDHERKRMKTPFDPIRSPTMAGGLFSISREYFEFLGTYDPGMDIWGGENLELSFRIWMCGGTLYIVPCSHVGHIFRKRSPYKWKPGVNVVKKNSIRLAEVWMDDYKNYYYERFNHVLGDYGDVTSRKELRKRLQCKSFDWYVKNIFPDLFIPGEAVASGEIRNQAQSQCLDSSVDHNAMNKPVKMWPCHNQGGNQYWMLSKNGEIRRDEGCFDFTGQGQVQMYTCHGQKGNQFWEYRADGHLMHVNSQRCMELSGDGQSILMEPCGNKIRQLWLWKRKDGSS
ncbi:polypeptide N-acetylgalactosaminyltransferase 5 [Lingula anatina]|uniref:Polypeptide N-acetylgalactosaminyltransferase n=1 Tax=Lingula anatina TaxID=7574 RepID=A0A1S3HAU3_LINAN|nr:polypeptide N-acetylgalactosaminyltransferase 5 [Lingula anatina]XP_023931181.1 polypeptide N-acetylgalactosaminyltransferase 5 [Lingula anatina]|eukprot:XP_013382243.1 polypeptide N-acetylgalactosaminyltransferase 5 [Lingula anatina]